MNAVHAPPIGQFDNNGGAHALADGMSGMSLGPYDAHENSPELWGAEAVCSWLTRNGFGALVEGFMQNDIRGAQLFNLQPDDYYQLGVTQLGVRKRLENAIAQLGPQSSNGSGPSYGNIENDNSKTVGGQSQTYKLFVGQIPKSASFEEVKLLFEEFGTVSDCVILRNKYTGESKGCGFVKYSTKEEGDAAIKALHNNRAMAPSTALLQVQFAHGEQVEGGEVTEQYKLFVGQLPKETSEAEVSKLFGGFGELTEVCLLRHPDGNSKGCGFVKFSNRDAAVRAIAALNGQKPLEGGTAPLNIEFAETKRDKQLKRVGMLGGGLMGGMGAMGGVNGAGMYGGAGAGLFSPYNNLAGQRGVAGGAAFRGPLPPVGGMGPPGGGGGPGGGGYGQFPIGPGPAAFMGGGGGMFAGGGAMYGGAGGGFPIGEPPQSNLGFTGGAAPGVGRYPPIGAGKNYVQGPGGANIFVYNLPPEVQDGDLASLFFGFGQILSTRVYIDKATGRSKGFGFVSFFNSESAAAAVQAMNNYEWFGRKLKVQVKKSFSMRFQTFLAPSDSCAVSDVPCARFRSLAGTGTLPTGAAWQICLCVPASLSCFSLNFTSCVYVCVCECCCCYVFLSCSDGACEFWSNRHSLPVDVGSSPGACDILSAATLLGSVLPGQNVFPEICFHAEILEGG